MNAIKKARSPNTISFGICLQVKAEEIQENLPLSQLSHCRIIFVEALKSKGIGWARTKAQAVWDGEPYTLQIDSHMRFEKHWDATLIKTLENCPSHKPIITAYCSSYEDVPNNYCLGPEKFNINGGLMLVGARIAYKKEPGMFISGHFLFAKSDFFQEVPPDPRMQFLYEETTLGPRAWTHGWDIFHPSEHIMRHRWNRSGRKLNWDDRNVLAEEERSNKLYKELLGMEPQIHNFRKYGLGKVRTLQNFEKVSGVSFRNRTVSRDAQKGIFRLLS